ncbi:hypothetical protein M0805_007996 [Coniferiporia weirii]|nr:hypothetical protein M0805_007996 [Coniferiporia weirii]
MPNKHVHWSDSLAVDEDDNVAFIPPSPSHIPSLSSTNDDDDSVHDSSPPSTPPSTYGQSVRNLDDLYLQQHARVSPLTIRVAARPHNNGQFPLVRSPDTPSWVLGGSPSSDPFRPSSLSRTIPPFPTPPQKTVFPTVPGQTRTWQRGAAQALHALLTHTSDTHAPAIVWDVGDEPTSTTVRVATANGGSGLASLPTSMLCEPATNPSQTEIRIHCVGHKIYDPLIVRAAGREADAESRRLSASASFSPIRARSSSDAAEFVTILHVLRGIYHYLQLYVSASEYAGFGSLRAPGLQTAIASAFHERRAKSELHKAMRRTDPDRGHVLSHHSPSHQIQGSTTPAHFGAGTSAYSQSDTQEALRRLDCLLGQTRFLGLNRVEGKPNEWYICVSSP